MAETIYETIKDSDGVECFIKRGNLVRCKDCKFRNDWNHCRIAFGSTQTPDDWFCADGERRSDVGVIQSAKIAFHFVKE